MLSKDKLSALVQELVPTEYKPTGSVEAEGPCLMIEVWRDEDLQTCARKLGATGEILGFTLSYERLLSLGGRVPAPKWKGKYGIILSSRLDLEQAKFTLMHEVGHVDWEITQSHTEATTMEKELYANAYAIAALGEAYGIPDAFKLRDRCIKKVSA